ncbi:MAG: hypothetical protein ABEL51_04605 [Salinibacter sp.]
MSLDYQRAALEKIREEKDWYNTQANKEVEAMTSALPKPPKRALARYIYHGIRAILTALNRNYKQQQINEGILRRLHGGMFGHGPFTEDQREEDDSP